MIICPLARVNVMLREAIKERIATQKREGRNSELDK